MRHLLRIFVLLGGLLSRGTASAEPLVFGVVPQQSAVVTADRWGPLIEALAEQTGTSVELAVTPDIPTFEACLAAGAFDVVYMNPYHYVVFSERSGYRAIAHRVGPGLRGIIVARRDQRLDSLRALDGERIAFPSPAAFGASILLRGELLGRGMSIEPVYVQSHASVYLAVNARVILAGGGVDRTFRVAPEFAQPNLHVVYQTDEYTPHAIATHPSLSSDMQDAVQSALQTLAVTHPQALLPLEIRGWQVPGAQAYDDVRALNIPLSQAGMLDLEDRTCHFG